MNHKTNLILFTLGRANFDHHYHNLPNQINHIVNLTLLILGRANFNHHYHYNHNQMNHMTNLILLVIKVSWMPCLHPVNLKWQWLGAKKNIFYDVILTETIICKRYCGTWSVIKSMIPYISLWVQSYASIAFVNSGLLKNANQCKNRGAKSRGIKNNS